MGNKAKGIFGSLPILAAAFGRERGVTVNIGGSTAWADGKRIQLPDLPLDCDEELEAKAFGFLYHETGHMEFTDFHAKLDCANALELSMYRSIEDVRMEAARNLTYPGSAASLSKLMAYLSAEGRFGVAEQLDNEPPHVTLGFGVLVKLRADYLGQPIGQIRDLRWQKVRDLVGDAGMVKLEVLLSKIDELDTTADSVAMAKALVSLLQSIAEEPPEPEPEQESNSDPQQSDDDAPTLEGDDADSDAADGDADDAGDQGNGGKSGDGDAPTGPSAGKAGNSDASSNGGPGGDDDGQGDQSSDTSPGDGSPSDARSGGQGHGADVGGDQPSAPDRDAIRQALSVPVDHADGDPSTDVGDMTASSLRTTAAEATANAGDLTTASKQNLMKLPRREGGEIEEVAGASKLLRTRLAAVMDAKARTRVVHRRHGNRMDGAVIHRLFTGNTRVFVRKEHARKVNTAVQVLLDRSSSMRHEGRMVLARKAALAAAMGIEQIHGCKVAVAAFPGTEVLKDFDERVRGVSGRFAISETGSTPMGAAMLAVAPGLSLRREERKLLIVATDGDPDDPQRVAHIIKQYEASGVEVVAVGIQTDAVKALFPSWTVINEVAGLSTALFDVVKEKLKRAA